MLEVAAEAAEEATGQAATTSEPLQAQTSEAANEASNDKKAAEPDLAAPADEASPTFDDRDEHRAAV